MFDELEILLREKIPHLLEKNIDVFFFPDYFNDVIIPLLWGTPFMDDYAKLVDDAKTILKCGLSSVIIMDFKERKIFATSKEAYLGEYN